MTHVTVGFSKPKGLSPIASLIRLAEGTPYNHVFIKFREPVTGELLIFEASYTVVYLVRAEQWEKGNEVVHDVRIYPTPAEHVDILTKGFKALQKPYSFMSILGHLVMKVGRLPRNPYKDRGRSYICSELVAHLLNIPNPEEQTPRSIFEHLQPTLPPDHDEVV